MRKVKKEETRQKKERIETDNNIDPARSATETKQYQPFDTSLKHMKEKRCEVLLFMEIRGERERESERERRHHMAGRRQKRDSGDPL